MLLCEVDSIFFLQLLNFLELLFNFTKEISAFTLLLSLFNFLLINSNFSSDSFFTSAHFLSKVGNLFARNQIIFC